MMRGYQKRGDQLSIYFLPRFIDINNNLNFIYHKPSRRVLFEVLEILLPKSNLFSKFLFEIQLCIRLMGGGQSRSGQILKYIPLEWQFIQDQKGVRVFKNKDSQQQAEMVSIVPDPRRNIDTQLDIYNYRRTQDMALVKVYAVQNGRSTESTICGNSQLLKVLVERSFARLNDIPQLPFHESLYTLSQAIVGYNQCFSKFGAFDVTSRMIAVVSNGKIKVWVNQNFGQNHPIDQKPQIQMSSSRQSSSKVSKQQLVMVQNVLAVVEQKSQQGRFPEDFRRRIYSKANFVDAFNQIQLYCNQKQMELPNNISLKHLDNALQSRTPLIQQSPSKKHKNFQKEQPASNSLSFIPSGVRLDQQSSPALYSYEPRQTIIKQLAFSGAKQPNYFQTPLMSNSQRDPRFTSLTTSINPPPTRQTYDSSSYTQFRQPSINFTTGSIQNQFGFGYKSPPKF